MLKTIAIFYLILIHLFVGLVVLKSDVIQRINRKLERLQGAKAEPELTQFFFDMVSYHSRMDGSVPEGSVVFIGDSITQSLCVTAIVRPSVNYGIGGDTTAGVLQRVSTYRSINRASAVVIAIGLNDMKFRSSDEILKNYKAIAETVPSNVPVVFSAILPIDMRFLAKSEVRTQKRIAEINSSLEDFARNSKHVFFVNASKILIDSSGNLASSFHDGDGMHLNSKGYDLLIKFFIENFKESICLSMDCNKLSFGHSNDSN